MRVGKESSSYQFEEDARRYGDARPNSRRRDDRTLQDADLVNEKIGELFQGAVAKLSFKVAEAKEKECRRAWADGCRGCGNATHPEALHIVDLLSNVSLKVTWPRVIRFAVMCDSCFLIYKKTWF